MIGDFQWGLTHKEQQAQPDIGPTCRGSIEGSTLMIVTFDWQAGLSAVCSPNFQSINQSVFARLLFQASVTTITTGVPLNVCFWWWRDATLLNQLETKCIAQQWRKVQLNVICNFVGRRIRVGRGGRLWMQSVDSTGTNKGTCQRHNF